MEIETERSCILSASERWDQQYPPKSCQSDKKIIGNALRTIDLTTATAEDLFKIIGNHSWSTPSSCSECGAENVATVQIGQEPDYESKTAWVCENCLKKALALFDKERKQP